MKSSNTLTPPPSTFTLEFTNDNLIAFNTYRQERIHEDLLHHQQISFFGNCTQGEINILSMSINGVMVRSAPENPPPESVASRVTSVKLPLDKRFKSVIEIELDRSLRPGEKLTLHLLVGTNRWSHLQEELHNEGTATHTFLAPLL